MRCINKKTFHVPNEFTPGKGVSVQEEIIEEQQRKEETWDIGLPIII